MQGSARHRGAPATGGGLPLRLLVEDVLGWRLCQGLPVRQGIDRRSVYRADPRRPRGLADIGENPLHGGGVPTARRWPPRPARCALGQKAGGHSNASSRSSPARSLRAMHSQAPIEKPPYSQVRLSRASSGSSRPQRANQCTTRPRNCSVMAVTASGIGVAAWQNWTPLWGTSTTA